MKTKPMLTIVAAFALGQGAVAQPDLNVTGKAVNPGNRKAVVGDQEKKARLKQFAEQAERYGKRAELRVEKLPKYLASFGVPDAKTHEAMAGHMRLTAKARDPLVALQLQLRSLLARTATTEAEIKKSVDEQRTARKEYEAAFRKSLEELDKKINYSKNPRLEAALAALGVLDPDGSSYTSY